MRISTKARHSQAASVLRELGFSEAEAETYVAVLKSGAQSAYAAAGRVGQAPSNIYRVIEGLIRKGALVSDEGPSSIVRAVPIDDVLGNLRDAFETRTKTLERELAPADVDRPDPGTYRLERADQVLTRCRNMLAGAKSVVLVDAFPAALDAVSRDLVKATKRGVRTLVKCYDNRSLPATRTVRSLGASFATSKWPGQWLTVVVDGKESLIAYLGTDLTTVEQAVWTRSRYLAWAFHGALIAEISLAAISSEAAAHPDIPASKVMSSVRKKIFGDEPSLRDVAKGIF